MRDNSTKSPLYYQLFDSLVEYIQKDLQPHDQLPTEKKLELIIPSAEQPYDWPCKS